jgi:hypothetical protein
MRWDGKVAVRGIDFVKAFVIRVENFVVRAQHSVRNTMKS